MKNQETSWGGVADWYFDHLTSPDSYHNKVVLPNLIRFMDIHTGEKVLDLACGTGFFSHHFFAAGADVVGVDIGKELIALARKNVDPKVTFFVSSADDLSMITDGSINKIACVLAIQNIADIKKMMAECERVLVPGGKMYIVMNHPAFRIPKGSSWGWDEENKLQYRRVDQYLSEKKVNIDMHPGKASDEQTVSFHRSLQMFMKVFHAHHFAITRLEEWISHKESERGPRQKEEDRMRKEIPLFLCLEITRLI